MNDKTRSTIVGGLLGLSIGIAIRHFGDEEPKGVGYVGTLSLVGTEAEVDVLCSPAGSRPVAERSGSSMMMVRCVEPDR